MTALATVEDVAAVSRTVPDADEAQVERLLDMVSASVRRYVGLTFDTVEDDEVTAYPVDGDLVLPEWPITEATAEQNGAAVEVEVGASGRLYRIVGGNRRTWPPQAVTVTYTHGWTAVPDDVVMVVAEKAAERWNALSVNPTQVAGSTSTDIGGYSESQTFRIPIDSSAEFSAPHRAILDRYRRPRSGTIRLA